jgi:glycosyltransferase involved in cell wall biosynthesis
MRILLVSNNLGRGGKERQIHEIVKVMGLNHKLVVGLVLREPVISYDLSEAENIKTYVPEYRLRGKEFIAYMRMVTDEFNPDVVHTWESSVTVLTHLMRYFYFKRFKVVDGSMRYSKKFSKKTLIYWSARFGRMLSNKVISNSQAGMNTLDYSRDGKYKVVTNGMNLQRFDEWSQRRPSSTQPFVITMVASFTMPKDYKSLITVAVNMLSKKIPLMVNLIGDGPERSEVEGLVPNNYKSEFVFHGVISNPERVLMESHVGVLLNKKGHSEGYSNTVMESLAAALPTVCTLTGGNVEMVSEGFNGYLIQHEDVAHLEEVLTSLFYNNVLREELGKQAREFAEKQFSMERVLSDYLNIYSEVLGE